MENRLTQVEQALAHPRESGLDHAENPTPVHNAIIFSMEKLAKPILQLVYDTENGPNEQEHRTWDKLL